MKKLCSIFLPGLLLLTLCTSANAYNGMEEDYARCMNGQDKIPNSEIVRACTRLISNAQEENSLVGYFHAMRASANTDRRANCYDVRKALLLIKDEKLQKILRPMEDANC